MPDIYNIFLSPTNTKLNKSSILFNDQTSQQNTVIQSRDSVEKKIIDDEETPQVTSQIKILFDSTGDNCIMVSLHGFHQRLFPYCFKIK